MKIRSLFLLASLAIIFAGSAYAQTQKESKFEMGAYAMVAMPENGKFDNAAGGGGAYLRYYPGNAVALELAAEYAQWDFSTDVTGASGKLSGKLDAVPIMATIQYHFNKDSLFDIYLGGGGTIILIDGDASGTLTPGGSSKLSFDAAPGGHVCGGLNLNMLDSFAINLDAKYTWAQAGTSESVTDPSFQFNYGRIDMQNLTLRGGLSYKF